MTQPSQNPATQEEGEENKEEKGEGEEPTTTTTTSTTTTTTTLSSAPLPQPPAPPKHTQDLGYMHRPPRIVPNYGKRRGGLLPKSSVSRVLLYDNVTQQQMLQVRVTHLSTEQRRTGRLMDMHRKSFMVRRRQKQKHVTDTTHLLNQSLPLLTITANTSMGVKRTPAGARLGVLQEEGDDPSPKTEGRETLLTPRTAAEEGGERGGVGSLPSLTPKRRGASSSQGFAVQPSPSARKAGSGPRTANAAPREGHATLPDIGPRQAGRASLHMQGDTRGLTRLVHTFRHPARWGGQGGSDGKGKGGKRKGGGGRTTVEDERYRMLERLLVRIEPPNEGYLELSPSFHCPRKTMTFTRPSSFHSSVHRGSSSSSVIPGPIIIGSWLSSVI